MNDRDSAYTDTDTLETLTVLQRWLVEGDEDRFVELQYFKSTHEWTCLIGVRGRPERFYTGRASHLAAAVCLAALCAVKTMNGVSK